MSNINIGISTEDRANIANALSRVLADSYMLYLKTHNFHWNVTGPMFQTLHIMFMEQYTELWNALDNIAERIRAKEEAGVPNAQEMIRQLVDGQEALIRTVREAFKIADEAGDQPSAGMLSDRMEIHEKNAWMLRSFLENGQSA